MRFVSIQVPTCVCEQQPDGSWKPKRVNATVTAIANKSGTANNSKTIISEHEELCKANEELCLAKNKEFEAYLSVPDHWPTRSGQKPQLAIQYAENTRNGANPGLTPRRNISTTVSFDTGTIAVAATIPVTPSIGAGGLIQLTASDYLGAPYSTFANGGGDLASDTLPEALLEMANLLAAAEKAVTPAENQPNNVQVQFDLETGSATISANMPFTTAAATNGDVTVHAIDYL